MNSKYKIVNMFFKTWGVTFTDGFHLFKMIRDTTLLFAVSILLSEVYKWNILLSFAIVKIGYSTIFHVFYNGFKR